MSSKILHSEHKLQGIFIHLKFIFRYLIMTESKTRNDINLFMILKIFFFKDYSFIQI